MATQLCAPMFLLILWFRFIWFHWRTNEIIWNSVSQPTSCDPITGFCRLQYFLQKYINQCINGQWFKFSPKVLKQSLLKAKCFKAFFVDQTHYLNGLWKGCCAKRVAQLFGLRIADLNHKDWKFNWIMYWRYRYNLIMS